MKSREKKRSLIYESVIEHIKTDLLSGTLQPGSRLPTVAKLSKQLGIGTASVREAYRVLESIGLLEITRGRGTYVSDKIPDGRGIIQYFHQAERHTLTHVIEARKLVEPGVAALAAQRATEAERQAIVDTAVQMETLAKQELDFTEPDVLFHELILVAAHNPVIAGFLSAINPLLLDSRRLSTRMPGATNKAIHFHKLIALAINDGNEEAAHSLMYEHVRDVETDLVKFLEAGGSFSSEFLFRVGESTFDII